MVKKFIQKCYKNGKERESDVRLLKTIKIDFVGQFAPSKAQMTSLGPLILESIVVAAHQIQSEILFLLCLFCLLDGTFYCSQLPCLQELMLIKIKIKGAKSGVWG